MTIDKMIENLPSFEWTREKQLEWELKRKEESHQQELERMSIEKSKLYVENVLLKRELEQFQNLRSEVFDDIQKVWMYDSSYGLDDNETIDRNNLIERVFYKIARQWID